MPEKVNLKEMTEQATLSAGRSLSKFTGEKVGIEFSETQIGKLKRILRDVEPESRVAGIYLPITGEIMGATLLILPEEIAYILSDVLAGREVGMTHHLTELDKSALKELGNIICGSFFTVFSNTLKIKIIENIPQFGFDMFGAILDQIIAKFALKPEEALVIEITFIFKKMLLKSYIVILFDLAEIKAMIDAMGGVAINE